MSRRFAEFGEATVLESTGGHRWLAMLESGEATSMKEITRREVVDDSYVSRMVNLTTLATRYCCRNLG